MTHISLVLARLLTSRELPSLTSVRLDQHVTSPQGKGVLRVRGNLMGGLLVPLGIWGHRPRGPDPRPLSSLPLRQRDISASPSAFGKGIITRAAYP